LPEIHLSKKVRVPAYKALKAMLELSV
jgi:hypothetical protein